MKKQIIAMALIVIGLFIVACGATIKTTQPEPEKVQITASYDVSGEDVTVYVSDCNNAVVKQNDIIKPIDCNTNTATFKVVYLTNHINVSTMDGTVILDDSFEWDVPANEPDSLYMPNHGMDVQCAVGRRWCGMHTNCLKISVYGY